MKDILNQAFIKEYLPLPCNYPKRYTVFTEDDQCTKIGIILRGQIKLSQFSYSGKEIKLSILNPGDIFGDFLIYSDHPYYPGHLITVEPSSVVYIDKDKLNVLLKRSDKFREYFLKNYSKKATLLNEHQKILSQQSLRDKLLMWLKLNQKYYSDKHIPISSKTALAKYLNTQRPSLSRILRTLKEEGLLDYDKDYIWLIQADYCPI
jgi:CRP-like cAMP-binding protein